MVFIFLKQRKLLICYGHKNSKENFYLKFWSRCKFEFTKNNRVVKKLSCQNTNKEWKQKSYIFSSVTLSRTQSSSNWIKKT